MRFVPLLVLLLAGSASAGNHFILEGDFGAAKPVGIDAVAEPGGTFGATFGFGGRIPGHAPAYYLVGRVGRSGFGFRGPEKYGSAAVELRQTELSAGGRIYLPINHRLRFALQLTLGGTYDSATVDRDGHDGFDYEDEQFTVFTDVGLQYRLTDQFSLGIGGGISWLPHRGERPQAAAIAAGVDESPIGRARLGLTTTIHF